MSISSVTYDKFIAAHIKSLSFFSNKFSFSKLFEGTAFRLTFCCRLYALLVTFTNNIQNVNNI